MRQFLLAAYPHENCSNVNGIDVFHMRNKSVLAMFSVGELFEVAA